MKFVLFVIIVLCASTSSLARTILVLDNCDKSYRGKTVYADNLTWCNPNDGLAIRTTGLNSPETIGSSHFIAVDPRRKCVWVIAYSSRSVKRFNLSGEETGVIQNLKASALAIDPATGNLWATVGTGRIGEGRTIVFDPQGKEVASHDISGWDIAYDGKSHAFCIVDQDLVKISARTGNVVYSKKICSWCASSIAVDQQTGDVWIAVPQGESGPGSRLLKYNEGGKRVASVPLGSSRPLNVSVDRDNGCIWLANHLKSIQRFSNEGVLEFEHAAMALSVQPGENKHVWMVTPTDIQRLTPSGEITMSISHEQETTQAWTAVLDH